MTEPQSTDADGSRRTLWLIVAGIAALLVVLIVILIVNEDDDEAVEGDFTAEEITDAQTALAAVGCYTGPIDGQNGAQTQQAVVDFQTAAGLDPDGVPGPATVTALEEAVAAGQTVCDGSSADSGSADGTGSDEGGDDGETAPPPTIAFSTSDGISQTLDMTTCSSFEDGGIILAGATETSDLDIDWDGSGSTGSMNYTSVDGNRQGTVTQISGSGADDLTGFIGDLADGGTFEALAPCPES